MNKGIFLAGATVVALSTTSFADTQADAMAQTVAQPQLRPQDARPRLHIKDQVAPQAARPQVSTQTNAQFNRPANGNNNGATGTNRGGNNATLPLPDGVNRVVSIDAYNILLAESQDDYGAKRLSPIIIRHVYSGGIARLFGGSSIPTELFVTPGTLGNTSGGGGGNRGGNVSSLGGGNQNGGIGGTGGGINSGGFNGGNSSGGVGNISTFQVRPQGGN